MNSTEFIELVFSKSDTVIAERIKHVEEEYEVQTDDESDSETDLSLSQAEARFTYRNYMQKNFQDLICDKCDFVGET